MKRALTLAAGFGVGYVVGARAGREKFDQMKLAMHDVGRQPAVVEMRENLQERVETASKAVVDKAAGLASGLTGKLHKGSHDEEPSTPVAPAPLVPGEYPAAPTGIGPDGGV
ncbi:hypothetical protein ABH926_004464 [Catenulispora sp. GP43]|uniref:hypothetical protein n=1 Tax=Catenulispora sp. GP43 TaxID=3156263 RepID=UPI00351794FA